MRGQDSTVFFALQHHSLESTSCLPPPLLFENIREVFRSFSVRLQERGMTDGIAGHGSVFLGLSCKKVRFGSFLRIFRLIVLSSDPHQRSDPALQAEPQVLAGFPEYSVLPVATNGI